MAAPRRRVPDQHLRPRGRDDRASLQSGRGRRQEGPADRLVAGQQPRRARSREVLLMGSTQGASALSVVNITVPRGVKAAWVRASQARGMKLTDWLVESVRRSMMMQTYPIPEALAPKYHGAGHALAAVTGGQIVDLVYVEDALPDYDQDAPDALRST